MATFNQNPTFQTGVDTPDLSKINQEIEALKVTDDSIVTTLDQFVPSVRTLNTIVQSDSINLTSADETKTCTWSIGNTGNSNLLLPDQGTFAVYGDVSVRPLNTLTHGKITVGNNGTNEEKYSAIVPATTGSGYTKGYYELWHEGGTSGTHSIIKAANAGNTITFLGGKSSNPTLNVVGTTGTGRIYDDRFYKPPALVNGVALGVDASNNLTYSTNTLAYTSYVDSVANVSTGFQIYGSPTLTWINGKKYYVSTYFGATGQQSGTGLSFTITSFPTKGPCTIDILIVGGGGGGGCSQTTGICAGGGGAGSVIEMYNFPLNTSATLPQTININVGSGGQGAWSGNGYIATNGDSSTVEIPGALLPNNPTQSLIITAGGGGFGSSGSNAPGNGTSGYQVYNGLGTSMGSFTATGSGGGSAGGSSAVASAIIGGTGTTISYPYTGRYGEVVSGGGMKGGNGSQTANYAGAGGGGYRQQGQSVTSSNSAWGGAGWCTTMDGTNRLVAGGGCGSSTNGTKDSSSTLYNSYNGKAFGGADGSLSTASPNGSNGVYATGGGGGGGNYGGSGGNGGAGLVIIRFLA